MVILSVVSLWSALFICMIGSGGGSDIRAEWVWVSLGAAAVFAVLGRIAQAGPPARGADGRVEAALVVLSSDTHARSQDCPGAPIRLVALDLDGVVWRGSQVLPGAPEALARSACGAASTCAT